MGYSGRTLPETLHQRLTAAPRGATGPAADTAAAVTAAFVAVLRTLTTQIEALAARISEQLDLHPDAPIFTSLPRSGRVRAARLLAEIGDARGRFPTADSLACLAGVAPSTRQSGKVEVVSFRWGADRQLRDAICDFAGDSRHANPWAADLYHRARARGHDHPHAVRVLARAWVDIIWACWTTNTPYDPDQTPRPATHPQPRSTDGGLTQGNSSVTLPPSSPTATSTSTGSGTCSKNSIATTSTNIRNSILQLDRHLTTEEPLTDIAPKAQFKQLHIRRAESIERCS